MIAVTCRTEEQAERLRRAGYSVTICPSSSPAPRRAEPEVSNALAELKAATDGQRLGRQFQHNGFALAQHLRLPVEFVPIGELQNASRPSTTILGRLVKLPGQAALIQLADNLDGRQMHETLAHECGHALGILDERHADEFAKAFLKVHDDERPGHRWATWQRQAVERERRRAAARAGG